MNLFKLQVDRSESADVLNIGFVPGVNAGNDEYVVYVQEKINELVEQIPLRGKLIKINGACSLAIGAVLVHRFAHLYATVAVFDPKLREKGAYVVVISHGGLPVGTVID